MRNISGLDVQASCNRIARSIDESDFTNKRIAEMMGLSVQAINKWRSGRNLPDIENLFILSKILGVEVDYFLVQRGSVVEAEELSAAVLRRIEAYCYGVRIRCSKLRFKVK